MKHLKTLLSSACCLSICLAAFSSFGMTGAEAAAGITSDPGTRAQYEAKAQMEMANYNKNTKSYEVTVYPVGEDVTWYDIQNLVLELNMNLTAAAANSLAALAKIAYLETMSKFTDARFEKLTETVKAAFASLDEIDIEDLSSKITARLTKSNRTDGKSYYTTHNIFNVAGAQADGKSITSNSNDRLEVRGFSSSATEILQIPYRGTDKILWSDIGFWGDGKSIGKKDSGGNNFTSIKIAGWDNPDASPHGCSKSIAAMLTRTESDPAPTPEQDPNNHLVLTRYSGGTEPVLHFTQLGSLGAVGGGSAIHFFGTEGEAVVGSGSKTNTVTFAKFNDCNIKIKVNSDDNGNATITFGVYYK